MFSYPNLPNGHTGVLTELIIYKLKSSGQQRNCNFRSGLKTGRFCYIVSFEVEIPYRQFNFGLAPQIFGLVTSSNSLPKGQPRLFIFSHPEDCLSFIVLGRLGSPLLFSINMQVLFKYIPQN